jgi:long-subunit fatty acid transport protein
MSWAPSPQISFGATFNYLFGTIDHVASQIPQTTGATGGTFTDRTTLSGVNFTAGMVMTGLDRISETLRPFSLGVMITTRTNLHTAMETTYDFAPPPDAIPVRDTSTQTFGRISVPFSYGIGIGYQPAERWTVAADYSAQPWAGADFNGSSPFGIRNSYRFGIGAERAGSAELTARSFDRWAYRLGFTYAATYYALNGQQINEWGITGGVALPLTGESRVNIAAIYGGRGTTAGSLVKDKIFRLTVSLHISDVLPWFVQTEEE